MSLNGQAEGKNELVGSVFAPKMIQGKSAYEIAVMNGFEGTEKEWLEYLRAAQSKEIEESTSKAMSDINNAKSALLSEIEIAAEIVQEPGYSETAVMSQKAVTEFVGEISEFSPRKDVTNLWLLGDIEIVGDRLISCDIPVGDYTFNCHVTSTDTDANNCMIYFYNGSTIVKKLYPQRGFLISQPIVFESAVDGVRFYASNSAANGSGDTAVFSQLALVDNNAFTNVPTAKDEIARECMTDVEYFQKPNVYNGDWMAGRYDYASGAVYVGSSTAARNIYPVALDASKGYNIVVKGEYATNSLFYIFTLDASRQLIEVIKTRDNVLNHINGASFVNFCVLNYNANFPNEPLHIMVWECDDPNESYKEWLENGDRGNYTKRKLVISTESIDKAMLARDKARFDDSFNYVAYSSIYGSTGAINTAEHYIWAAKQGFTALKGDVRPTSDGELIMCHDAGFTLSSGHITTYNASNATPIHEMTAEQCLALRHSGTNQYVCSFDEYIKICKKYGKIAYITIRDEYIDEIVAAMFPILDKYNMRTRCIVNSFTLASLQAVRNVDSTITLSQVLGSGASINASVINNAIALGNCQICGFNFPNQGKFDSIEAEAIAYAKEHDIRLYQAQVNNMDDIDQLMALGISGAHMTCVPTL